MAGGPSAPNVTLFSAASVPPSRPPRPMCSWGRWRVPTASLRRLWIEVVRAVGVEPTLCHQNRILNGFGMP